jgi:hypothetical protein
LRLFYGFNIAILSGLFAALFSRLLGRWRGAIVALVCIAVYTLLVGAGASVVRAALMGGLTLFAARQLAESGYAPANPPEWIELTTDGEQMWVEMERK